MVRATHHAAIADGVEIGAVGLHAVHEVGEAGAGSEVAGHFRFLSVFGAFQHNYNSLLD